MTYDDKLPESLPETAVFPAPAAGGSDSTRKGEHAQGTARNRRAPGGQPANRNRERHGLRAARLPEGCRHIANAVYRFRESLESAVFQCHGQIDVYRAALVQSSTRHEQRAMLLSRWLRLEGDKLGTLERAQLLAQISAATDSRDKCLERLGLDTDDDRTVWASLAPRADEIQPSTGETDFYPSQTESKISEKNSEENSQC